ncbi:MAG: aminotransferase class I/II-fold pyridoxal phosphate-dependent enzyme [Flavobacteriaceae bacterium]
MNTADLNLDNRLDFRKSKGGFRELVPYDFDGVDFLTNDYLGLHSHFDSDLFSCFEPQSPEIGATGSRLISGHHNVHDDLEVYLADFYRAPQALLYTSGYTANIGLFQCLTTKDDLVFYDQLSHASIREGLRLGLGKSMKFMHNNLVDLEQKLARKSQDTKGLIYVVVESVYSMDGDVAPLSGLVDLCSRYGAHLIVDEAHGVGVFDPEGRGLVCSLGLEDKVYARVVTFGKAIACHGAAILGTETLKSYLINFSRSFIYTTGISIHDCRLIHFQHEQMRHGNQLARLRENIAYYQSIFEFATSSAIQIIPRSSDLNSLQRLVVRLKDSGVHCKLVQSPTVPEGEERIRICLHSFNTVEELLLLKKEIENE